MKLNLFIFYITLLCVSSCNNYSSSINLIEEYNQTLSFFGERLIDHFPNKEIKNKKVSEHLDTNGYHNTLSFRLTIYDAGNLIDSVLRLKSNKIIGEYKTTDSCLLVVNDYINIDNCGDPFRAGESTFIEHCSNSNYPVPNFWSDEFATNENRSKLPNDFVLYILDSKTGIYSKKIKKEQSSMPHNLKHGYSKGLAISKKKEVIIYWVIIW